MRTLILKVLPLILFISTFSFASQAEHLYNKGNAFYTNKVFDSAVVYYEQALNQGISSSILYYNLGNAYYRTEKFGKAILNYERAYKLSPDDKDIEANLKFAQMNITDRIPEPESNILEIFLDYLHSMLPLNAQLTLIIVLLFIISICFSFTLFIKDNKKLWFIYTGILSFLILVTLSLSAGIKIHKLEKIEYAIIMEEKVDAKNAPNGSTTLFTVHEGTKFKIIKKDKDWYFVSLANGVSGWINSSAVEKI